MTSDLIQDMVNNNTLVLATTIVILHVLSYPHQALLFHCMTLNLDQDTKCLYVAQVRRQATAIASNQYAIERYIWLQKVIQESSHN